MAIPARTPCSYINLFLTINTRIEMPQRFDTQAVTLDDVLGLLYSPYDLCRMNVPAEDYYHLCKIAVQLSPESLEAIRFDKLGDKGVEIAELSIRTWPESVSGAYHLPLEKRRRLEWLALKLDVLSFCDIYDATREMLLYAIKNNGHFLHRMPVEEQTKELRITAVKSNGAALNYIEAEWFSGEEYAAISMIACLNYHRALEYIDASHISDKNYLRIVQLAVIKAPWAITSVDRKRIGENNFEELLWFVVDQCKKHTCNELADWLAKETGNYSHIISALRSKAVEQVAEDTSSLKFKKFFEPIEPKPGEYEQVRALYKLFESETACLEIDFDKVPDERYVDYCKLAARTSPHMLKLVDKKRAGDDYVRIANISIRAHPETIKDIDHSTFGYNNLARVAVSRNGRVIQFIASPSEEIMCAAVNNDPSAIELIPPEQRTKQVYQTAIRRNGNYFGRFDLSQFTDEEYTNMALTAAISCNTIFDDINKNRIDDRYYPTFALIERINRARISEKDYVDLIRYVEM